MKHPVSIESRLDKLIIKQCDDSLLNHLKTILLIRDGYFIGKKSMNFYTIWKYSLFWSGPFYPVLDIVLEGEKVVVRSKMNIVGKILCFFIVSFITFTMIKHGKLSFCMDISCLALNVLSLMLIALFVMPWIMVYRFYKRYRINELNSQIYNNLC